MLLRGRSRLRVRWNEIYIITHFFFFFPVFFQTRSTPPPSPPPPFPPRPLRILFEYRVYSAGSAISSQWRRRDITRTYTYYYNYFFFASLLPAPCDDCRAAERLQRPIATDGRRATAYGNHRSVRVRPHTGCGGEGGDISNAHYY